MPPLLSLRTACPQEASGLSDRGGSELAASKNKEIDAILGSEDGASSAAFKFGGRSEASASLVDRNKEIENLLSGPPSGSAGGEVWGGAFSSGSAGFGADNAFARDTDAWAAGSTADAWARAASPAGSPTFAATAAAASGQGTPDHTPRLGGYGGSSDAGGAGSWFGQAGSDAGGGSAAAAGGIGTGTVLHTFVGDYQQPEEVSVFEGDQVRAFHPGSPVAGHGAGWTLNWSLLPGPTPPHPSLPVVP